MISASMVVVLALCQIGTRWGEPQFCRNAATQRIAAGVFSSNDFAALRLTAADFPAQSALVAVRHDPFGLHVDRPIQAVHLFAASGALGVHSVCG